LVAGAGCYGAIQLKHRFGYDDSLDVVGVHFVGGLIGTLLIGLFADAKVNPAVADAPGGGGLFFDGSLELLVEQALAAVIVIAFSAVVTFVIVKVIDLLVGIRVSEEDET